MYIQFAAVAPDLRDVNSRTFRVVLRSLLSDLGFGLRVVVQLNEELWVLWNILLLLHPDSLPAPPPPPPRIAVVAW